jgi:Tfp pilus assembly protein PilF
MEVVVSDPFFLDRGQTRFESITLRPIKGASESSQQSTEGAVSARELQIPEKAASRFNKGLQAMKDQDWKKAVRHFEEAIAFYPEYDSAYDNLGVAYLRDGDVERGRQALERAIQINGRNLDALKNLARVYMKEKNFAQAETMLRRAVEVEPLGTETLVMLSSTQLSSGKFAEALAGALKVHSLPHQQYAVVHIFAARALEAQQHQQEARAEYQAYLDEAPEGASAPLARQAVTRLSASK